MPRAKAVAIAPPPINPIISGLTLELLTHIRRSFTNGYFHGDQFETGAQIFLGALLINFRTFWPRMEIGRDCHPGRFKISEASARPGNCDCRKHDQLHSTFSTHRNREKGHTQVFRRKTWTQQNRPTRLSHQPWSRSWCTTQFTWNETQTCCQYGYSGTNFEITIEKEQEVMNNLTDSCKRDLHVNIISIAICNRYSACNEMNIYQMGNLSLLEIWAGEVVCWHSCCIFSNISCPFCHIYTLKSYNNLFTSPSRALSRTRTRLL